MSSKRGSLAHQHSAKNGGYITKHAGPAHARAREDSDENQVVPFSLDDGEDDHEEIRRRRLSSASSCSDDDEPRYRGKRSYHRERENEWEKASNEAASSSENDPEMENYDEDREDDEYEQPESPRRTNRKTQQSSEDESESDSGNDNVRPSAQAGIPAVIPELSQLSKLAVFPGSETQLVQGYILRVKTLLHSRYNFYINDQLVLMAEKQLKNRTSNYHIFDMTRSAVSSKLTKKSGNYLGKLRSNFSKRKNVLLGNLNRKTELGAILFGKSTSSTEPRQLTVILPSLSRKRQEIEGLTVGDSSDAVSMLISLYKGMKFGGDYAAATRHLPISPSNLQIFENKQPVFENGFYRLNFNGRVSIPSVKNFQLVRSENIDKGSSDNNQPKSVPAKQQKELATADIFLQFGKVDDKKFHLDFRAPITPIQAFGIALAQFNL